jgi:deoxyribonuclease V
MVPDGTRCAVSLGMEAIVTGELSHRWDLDEAEARALQRQLAGQVVREDRFGEIRTVAGVDLGFPKTTDGKELGRAAVVVLSWPSLDLVEERVVEQPVTFPYIPGLLSFREAPVGLAAIGSLEHRPDLLLVDGHGLAHPRRFGIACHLGLLLDLPTIGCAKSILVGHAEEPGPNPGDWSPLVHRGETIGATLRTRPKTKPIYVSIGHRVSLASAIALVAQCGRGYRLPEPTRLADRIASRRGERRS